MSETRTPALIDELLAKPAETACMEFKAGNAGMNATLRERLGIDPQNAAQASGIIKQALKAELIRTADPAHPKSGYVPYWA